MVGNEIKPTHPEISHCIYQQYFIGQSETYFPRADTTLRIRLNTAVHEGHLRKQTHLSQNTHLLIHLTMGSDGGDFQGQVRLYQMKAIYRPPDMATDDVQDKSEDDEQATDTDDVEMDSEDSAAQSSLQSSGASSR